MAKIQISRVNWYSNLENAIKSAQPDDTIVVHNEAMKDIALFMMVNNNRMDLIIIIGSPLEETPTSEKNTYPIAVAIGDVAQYGCPYCGYYSEDATIKVGRTVITFCRECIHVYVMLAEDVTRSEIRFGDYFPEQVAHPRWGIPYHRDTEKRPEQGGEYFSSRGIGVDTTPGCFVCGGDNRLRKNLAAFVKSRNAGARVVALFQLGARLDYRESELTWIQVKVGACGKHEGNLERLHALTIENGGIITAAIIQTAIGI